MEVHDWLPMVAGWAATWVMLIWWGRGQLDSILAMVRRVEADLSEHRSVCAEKDRRLLERQDDIGALFRELRASQQRHEDQLATWIRNEQVEHQHIQQNLGTIVQALKQHGGAHG